MVPLKTVRLRETRLAAPAPVAITSGKTPVAKESVVIITGWKRSLAAFTTASCSSILLRSRRFLANSTIRIAVFAAMPMSSTSPI